jgi:hypothetical protein
MDRPSLLQAVMKYEPPGNRDTGHPIKELEDWPESLKEQQRFPVHAIKAYGRSRGTAPLNFNLSTS